MRFNFKKISALATSTLMVGMTMGVAAAANYPDPFIKGSTADVAIVQGTGSGVSYLDSIEAGYFLGDLQTRMGTGSGGSSGSVSGEAYPLFTDSSKVYMNDSINAVKSIITESELPTVLADQTFEGDVTADVTQTINLASNSRVVFGKHPTSDVDPVIAVSLGTSATTGTIYNATVNFNKAVNFTSSDSIGEEITLFGQTFTVGAGTTTTDLVLFKSSQRIDLSIGGSDPSSQSITIDGASYTIELIGASDSAATIKVTNSAGASQSKEISEDNSKKVQGIDVAVTLADEDTATNRLTAQVTVGANRIELTDGGSVKVGSDEDAIDGTNVDITTAGNLWSNVTSFIIQVAALDSDVDAIVSGEEFLDPVFGSFKIDFAGINVPADSTAREMIEVKGTGNDKASVTFMNHQDDEESVEWYYNVSATARLGDNDGDAINVVEMAQINRSEYVVVGNEDEGYLLELTTVTNQSTGYSNDEVEFKDVFPDSDGTRKTFSATITGEGAGTITIGGKTYTVTYAGTSSQDAALRNVRLNYPDSTSNSDTTDVVLFPTIETSKGASLFFYEPQTIALTNWNGASGVVDTLTLPDGDGYTTVTFAPAAGGGNWTVSGAGSGTLDTLQTSSNVTVTIGAFTYNITGTGTANTTNIHLIDVGGTRITLPAIGIFEEQDDSSSQLYRAMIVKMEGGGSSDSSVGPSDVEFTWGSDAYWDEIQTETDDDLYMSMDYFGTIVTTDRSDSDSYVMTISYPDVQVYPQLYVASESAAITAGTAGTSGSSTPLGKIIVMDSEVGSVSTKNLIVVGGSCINSAAAALVGGAHCGSAWTEATGVGSGQFLVKGYPTNTLATGKLALLVAGYNAADTVNAGNWARTHTFDTSMEYKGTSSTSAEQVVA